LIALIGSVAAFVGVIVLRHNATLVGGLWLGLGIALYVTYRKTQGKPLRTRVTIPEEDLRRRSARETSKEGFGSILVPVFGGVLDDDIIGTAGRLAMEEGDEHEGAMIEALHVIEIPMSQPIDAPVPAERLTRARKILARAKEVGEEYQGVEVATATVRARSTGEAIVKEATRRGVEVIVLAAERPSRIRGGPLLGGVEPRAAEFIGKVTEYVARKAPCRVILTAPPETDVESLATSIAANPHVSEGFAQQEAERLERMKGVTAEHGPVDPGVVHPTDATRPHEAEADHHAVADEEDPDDFIDTIA
jgi:APA family basic amino acid/polyamine antiporter